MERVTVMFDRWVTLALSLVSHPRGCSCSHKTRAPLFVNMLSWEDVMRLSMRVPPLGIIRPRLIIVRPRLGTVRPRLNNSLRNVHSRLRKAFVWRLRIVRPSHNSAPMSQNRRLMSQIRSPTFQNNSPKFQSSSPMLQNSARLGVVRCGELLFVKRVSCLQLPADKLVVMRSRTIFLFEGVTFDLSGMSCWPHRCIPPSCFRSFLQDTQRFPLRGACGVACAAAPAAGLLPRAGDHEQSDRRVPVEPAAPPRAHGHGAAQSESRGERLACCTYVANRGNSPPFHSVPQSTPFIINFKFRLQPHRNITSHGMKSLAFHTLLRWTLLYIAYIVQVFEGLHNQGQQTEVRDWVLLSLGSFVQRWVTSCLIACSWRACAGIIPTQL